MGQDKQDRGPEWVMLGVPRADGKVAIYASKELNHAELTHETDEYDLDSWLAQPSPRAPRQRIELTVNMRTFVVVVADTYAEALAGLLNVWSPEPDSERQALDPAVKAIAS